MRSLSKRKNKQKFFAPVPVFGQLVSLIQQANIDHIIAHSLSDKHSKKMKTKNHLYLMLIAVITRLSSIRELCALILAHKKSLHQMGLSHIPKRSTISYVNKHRDSEVFERIYQHLYKRYRSVILDSMQSPILKRLGKRVVTDSTIVGLFSSVMRTTGRKAVNGKQKGGIKLHCTIENGMHVPKIHYISEATVNDQKGIEKMELERGVIYIMDRGYLNYEFFDKLDEKGVYYVCRMKENAVYERIEEKEIPDSSDAGIIKDEIIEKALKDGKKIRIRRVAYWDDVSKKTYEYATNLMDIEVDAIPLLYKSRWQIEITFRQLKQNFGIKYFLGDNENAIKIQIWCCLIANLLMTMIHKRVRERRKDIAFSNVASFVRLNIHSYVDVVKFLIEKIEDIEKILGEKINNRELQLSLFESG